MPEGHFAPLDDNPALSFEDVYAAQPQWISELQFDSIRSANYVALTSGFLVDIDGSADFASGMTIGGGAKITGTLEIDSGEIVTDTTVPYWRLADTVSDDSSPGHVLENVRSATDDYNPKLFANDDIFGLYSRDAATAGADQAAIIVRRSGISSQARVELTLDQTTGADAGWLQMYDVGESVKMFELGGGTDWSAANLGAGEQMAVIWNKGDGGVLGIYGNPTDAEEILYVADGNPGSETVMFLVNNSGSSVRDDDAILPHYGVGSIADITTGIVNNAYTSMGQVILWDHTGTNRSVVAQATAQYTVVYNVAAAINVFIRVGISMDGGSTYTYGHNSDNYVGTAGRGSGSNLQMFEQHQRQGTATGDVIARVEYYVVGATDPSSFINISIMGHAHQLH